MSEIKELPWKPHTERLVAVIQMVEFPETIQGQPAENQNHEFFELHKIVESMIEICYEKREFIGFYDEIEEYRSQLVRFYFADDTITLMSATTCYNSSHFLVWAAMEIYHLLLRSGILCRVGIAFGKCVADFEHLLFAGDAFINAKSLAHDLLFYGIAMPPETLPLEDIDRDWIDEMTDEWIACEIPTKDGKLSVEILNLPAILESDQKVDEYLECLGQLNVDPSQYYLTELLTLRGAKEYRDRCLRELPSAR